METPPALRRTCPACGAALSLHERYSSGFCSDRVCRQRRSQALRQAEFAARLAQQRDAAAAELDDADATAAPVIVVPAHSTGLVPVPAALRRALRVHLMAMQPEVQALAAAAAAAAPAAGTAAADQAGLPAAPMSPATQRPAGVDALLASICARCVGLCCRHGNARHAFIDAGMMLRARQQRPQASHAELVDAYLDALPDHHVEGSCGFHGAKGCALPRAERSDICNDFKCRGFMEAERLAEAQGVRRVYLVRHDPDNASPGEFVSAG